jgi:predicted deacetylase
VPREKRERGARLAGLWPAAPPSKRTLAVALHDVEPATYERCMEIREWLDGHGVERVTLLVIPARDLHPVGERSPALTGWLSERRRLGDAIAQHGFQHEQLRGPRWSRRKAEFAGLDAEETRRAVDAGWRLLKLAGIEPDGFVAPAYAYTPALRQTLSGRFRWWAGLLGVHNVTEPTARHLAPAWGPRTLRAGALLAGDTLRLDLSPARLRHPYQLRSLERTLAREVRRRMPVTYDQLARYDELASAPLQAENTEASSELMPPVAA